MGQAKRVDHSKEVEPMNRTAASHIHVIHAAVVVAGILGLFAGSALAQPRDDLSNGMLIVHAPLNGCYTMDGICAYANLQDCASLNNYIPLSNVSRCWFVIAVFLFESQWCGVEFGIQYEETAPSITDYGFCVPSNGMEVASIDWPAPHTGTAVMTIDVPWTGNYLPVYWFTGYSYYGPGDFQLIDHPGTPAFTTFVNCAQEEFPAACLGALGFGMPGYNCCNPPPPPIFWACCLYDGSCIVTGNADECLAAGGVWHEGEHCEEVECPVPVVCCADHVCYFVHEEECVALGGVLHPEFVDCAGEPCEALTPATPTSWGAIKTTYK
jgi:hypothetical protein